MSDCIKASELQHLLRQFEPLKDVSVAPKEGFVGALLPNDMVLSGFVLINGELKAYEVEIDGKDLRNADDILLLVRNLLKSFEEAGRMPA